jgi:hypothetical protein
MPGEDGHWFLDDDEFARLFPERQSGVEVR